MSWKKRLPLFLGILAAGMLLTQQPRMANAEESKTKEAQTEEAQGEDAASEGQEAEKRTIPEHISISGQDVSGMTAEQANQVLADYLAQYDDIQFTLKAGEKSVTADGEDIALIAKNADVVERAMNYGSEGNLIARYKAAQDVKAGVQKDFAISLTADINTVKEYLEKKSDSLNVKAVNNGLKRENGAFQYVEGSAGVTVLTDKSAVAVADYISGQWDGGDASIDLITEVVQPRGTQEELSQVKDLLGAYHTDFSSSASGRKKNVTNGASKLNGTVLYPGETLSVYEVVSPFTPENGYGLGGAYENGTTVESYGGGICQVSTTLYNAVMRAELEIVTRAAHSMVVSYVEPSMDAAIAGTYKDFQFKNNQDTPIYIEGYTSGGILYFNIYGKETRPSNREVSFVSEVLETTEPVKEFVASDDLPVGTIKKTQSSHTGYKARLWKIVTVDGVEESRKVYNNSTYKVSNQIMSVGLSGASPEAAAAIKNAIATQNEDTIRAAVNQWAGGGTTTQQPPATQPAETTQPAAGGTPTTPEQPAQ